MLKIREAIVVEGRYDRIKLAALVDTLIVETGGFRIYRDREKQRFLRELAGRRGLVLLTDSDRAGFQIRGFLKGLLPPGSFKSAFIPRAAV